MQERYELNELAETIFKERYAKSPEESWEDASRRVARFVASAEENGKAKKFEELFYDEIVNNRFMPGGRIWYGAERPVSQALNCVAGETLIHTDEGLVPASLLAEQKGPTNVLTEDGTYRPAKWYNYGAQSLYRVVFSNGDEIFATEAHEWVVTRPGGKRERVTTGDLIGRNVPMISPKSFSYAEDDWLIGVRHGLVYGDGSRTTPGGDMASLRQFGDSRHLVEDYFNEHVEYEKIGALVVNSLPGSWKDLPSDESPSYLRGFIAGWIAADGCVDSRGHIMAHSAKYNDLVEIRRIAASVGLPSSSIKITRELNPWNGTSAPLWKLSFIKAGFYTNGQYDERLILKNKHRDYLKSLNTKAKQYTQKVVAVLKTDRVEDVFCCVEPETHTMVVGPGYLTGQCFVIPVEDSREGWGQMLYDTTVISGTGGGIGVNYSDVRPRGATIKGTGGVATGAVSAMKMQNGIAEELRQGGGRRAALMQCLDITHPDIPEFLEAKLDRDELNNANISIVLNIDPESFRKLVEEDGEIEFEFNGLKTGETMPARKIWDKIVKNSWDSGEPGVLNGHLANKMNNIAYYEKLVSTNPCGEIWLGAYDCCCLGSLVLPRFIVDGEMDWDEFDSTIRLAVRFLDNVLTVNDFPLPQIKEKCQKNRRIGMGVTGLHSMLLELGLEYDSEEGLAFVDRLFDFMKNTSYDESATLAAEKGPFPGYSPEFLKGGFAKTLKRGIRSKIRHHGIRNCALMTVAPTGTTTMVCNSISTGIEPLFAGVFWRRWRKTDEKGYDVYDRELVVTEEYKKYGKLVRGAYDISVRSHFEMQKIVQKHVDNAVSKTINLPADFPVEELSGVWLEYLPDCKGTTLYRAGSRGMEPLVVVPVEEADEVIAQWESDKGALAEATYEELNAMDCASGVCVV